MEESDLHDMLRNTSVRFDAEVRKYVNKNLTKEQWEFAFAFLKLSLDEIKTNFTNNNIIE